MKRLLPLILLLLSLTAHAQDLLITITTAKSIGEEFKFGAYSFNKDINIKVDFGDGNLKDFTPSVYGYPDWITEIKGELKGQTIKVYGNKSKLKKWSLRNCKITTLDLINYATLEYLDCDNNQLTVLDVSNNKALTKLRCSSNQLTSLDVSINTVLTELSCSSNQLTALDVSNNKALTSLNCSKNQLKALDVSNNKALESLGCGNNQLTSLDVSNNKALESLGSGNNQLTSLDVNYNTALTSLSCDNNQLTALDVSINTALTSLSCDNNQLTSLDVSKNKALKYFQCQFNQLTSLDVSINIALTSLSCGNNQLTTLDVNKNTKLTSLDCSNNLLTSLGVSKNTALVGLYCFSNQLTSLDVSNNTALNILKCEENKLKLSTLPLFKGFYTYYPQQSLFIKENIDINTPLDLSSEYMIDGNVTNYTWKTTSGTILTEGVDYSFDNGITTFIKEQTEQVYCEMTYVMFSKLILKTTAVNITIPTSTMDIEVKKNKVYGFNKSIYIETASNSVVYVRNLTGKTIAQQKCISGTNQIPVLYNGIYIVTILVDGQTYTQKVVVN